MKKVIIVIVCMFFGISIAQAQYVLKNQEDVKWYASLPQEEVAMHYNTSLLLAGESLNYKVYCRNSKTKLLSKNSKIAYVELIGKNGAVISQKIRLNNGQGEGNFFVPVSVKTGYYKLIGYTRWMMNRKENSFYETDIAVVNPYAKINFTRDNATADPISDNNRSENGLSLITNSDSYSKRALVNLIVESTNVNALGNYSITVRKSEGIRINDLVMAKDSKFREGTRDVNANKVKTIGETIFLPEFKGEMLSGVVKNKTTGNPSVGVEVALSVLSQEAIQDVVKTNSKGIFYFQIKDNYKTPRALVQVLGDKRMDYLLKMDDDAMIDYSKFQFKELKLDEKYKDAIVAHSINNQIQNAYISVKRNKVELPNYPKPFFGNPMTTYKLDDYKRFLNVAETLDEVVDHAYHERRNGKTRYINVRERETDPYYDVDILPMVLVDGASIQDHQGLLSYETKDVESMSVLRQEYYYGDKVYQGVLMINTFNKDYYKNLNGDYLEIIDLVSPQLTTKYYEQTYANTPNFDRIPDQRNQLLWMPHLKMEENRKQIEFFTSDNPGMYQISLKGFTNAGQPVSIHKTFTVN